MSDAARLARLAYSQRPQHTPYAGFRPNQLALDSVEQHRMEAAVDAAYACGVSYSEALAGLRNGSASWAIIRLYYSSYYGIKSLLLINGVVPFNSGKGEMLLELPKGQFSSGGRSSHHWGWASICKSSAKGLWFTSQDSQDTYKKLRENRENVNYTHGFTDPELHPCLVTNEVDISKRFRAYRDDSAFFYTYLDEHLTVAYPTKLLVEVDAQLVAAGAKLSPERIQHLQALWKFRDRCLLT